MTGKQEEVLEACRDGIDIYEYDEETQEILRWLCMIGMCQYGDGGGVLSETRVFQSQAGKAHVSAKKEQAEKMAQHNANKVREKRSDRRFELLKILVTVVATLFVEHIKDIIMFIYGVFAGFD